MPVRISRPGADEYAPYYAKYVEKVPGGDLLALLERQGKDTAALLRDLPDGAARHRYAPDKWSVKEVLGHIADAERVFAYRALCIARGDQTPLPSFDENAYAGASGADARPMADLAAEFLAVRAASVALLAGLDEERLARRGTASGKTISVRALAHVIAGHEKHHVAILHERYGI